MLKMISNRGTQIFPDKGTIIDCIDASTCRLMLKDAKADLSDEQIFAVLPKLAAKLKWTHIEKLKSSTAHRASPRPRAKINHNKHVAQSR